MSETISKNILLRDSDGNAVAPITTMENVVTSDGSKIDTYIADTISSSSSSAEYEPGVTIKEAITTLNTTTGNMYTKSEVDNKFSTLESNVDWKEAVATYDDIATTYPEPEDGWTVNVKDTDYTYRYNGTDWVAISANAIPEATTSVNGLMTTDQVTKLNGVAEGAEVNVNADWNATSGDAQILNKPTKVSQFTNDSGFTTNTGTVTSVTVQGSDGLSGSGTVTTSGTVTLSNSGVRSITQDSSDGHKLSINTGGTSSTITIPDNNTTYSAGTGISLSGTTFSNSGVRSITQDSSDGHKLTINTNGTSSTITIPDNNTVTTATTTGSGNAVTSITASNGALTVTKDTTFLTSHQDISGKQDKSTAVTHVANTAIGGTSIPVYIDSTGAATACAFSVGTTVPYNAVFTDTTYSDATTSAHGLMTAAMVTKLNNIAAGATNVTNNNQLANGAGYITSSGSCSYATSAGSANSVTWSNVSGKPYSNFGNASQQNASATAGSKSTCAMTDSNGYINLNYINSNTSNSENPTIGQIIVTNGSDNYYRKASLAHLKSSLNYTYSDVGAAASSHTHSYVPLSGGTMTGGLTLNGSSLIVNRASTDTTLVELRHDNSTYYRINLQINATPNYGLFYQYSSTGSKWLIYGNKSGTVTANTSDRRKKNYIKDTDDTEVSNILGGLTVIDFTLKDDDTNQIQSGVFAQDLRDILLENGYENKNYLFVAKNDPEDTSMSTDITVPETDDMHYELDYTKFIPVLIKGWQILNNKVNTLEEKIAELESK